MARVVGVCREAMTWVVRQEREGLSEGAGLNVARLVGSRWEVVSRVR